MGANIEIKAAVTSPARLEALARELSDEPVQVILQEDTFFRAERGRLKLRRFAPDRGELIFYERSDDQGPTRSDTPYLLITGLNLKG